MSHIGISRLIGGQSDCHSEEKSSKESIKCAHYLNLWHLISYSQQAIRHAGTSKASRDIPAILDGVTSCDPMKDEDDAILIQDDIIISDSRPQSDCEVIFAASTEMSLIPKTAVSFPYFLCGSLNSTKGK